MKKILGILSLILILLLGGTLVAGAVWYTTAHAFVDGVVYPKDTQLLDFREEAITPQKYETLRQAFPDAEILWNVPFQGGSLPHDTQTLTVTSLTEDDVQQLDYFEELKALDARGCTDYALLEALREQRPELEVRYTVAIGGEPYDWDTETIAVTTLTEEDADLLPHLPRLRHLDARGCRDYSLLMQLQQNYPNLWVEYTVEIAGTEFSPDTVSLAVTGAPVRELLEKLQYLPLLQTVGVQDPIMDGITMTTMAATYPQIDFSWETIIGGCTVTNDQTELDLSEAKQLSLEDLEQELENYPLLETVFLGLTDVDYDELAAFRERKREQYKVVWTVPIGQMMVRTDETTFMPTKFGYDLTEEESYNLRYCEDMICVDVGHKDIETCCWAAFMPHLKYLIIADTRVSDLTPLTDLKELIYLEAFVTTIYDYSPLLTCTALEDLNISYTYGDYKVIYKMTWLKRLWWAGTYLSPILAQEKLPDTELMFHRISSTGSGWREGQNYYDMRELLDMRIMYG